MLQGYIFSFIGSSTRQLLNAAETMTQNTTKDVAAYKNVRNVPSQIHMDRI